MQSSVDLQSVVTHEYGHYFGLDHTSVGTSTMIPFIISNSTVQRTLELDDRADLSTVYRIADGALSPLEGPMKARALELARDEVP